MRDFRDAKTMAQTLRDNLTAKAVTISHSESLELVSKMLGVADWNTLSAMLRSGGDRPRSMTPLDGATGHPAIPIRDFVPFPGMTFPLFIGREKTISALEAAYERQQDIVLAVQKEITVDEPGSDDVHLVGLLAKPLEAVRMPDTTLKVLTQVERRVAIRRFTGESGAFQADIAGLDEAAVSDAQNLIQAAVKRFESYAAKRELRVHPATRVAIDQSDDPGRIADIIASYLVLPLRERRALLCTVDPVTRLEKISSLLDDAAPPPKSAELVQTVGLALAHANRRRHAHATLEHFLLALTDDKDAAAVLQGCGVDLALLRENLDHYVEIAFDKLSGARTEARPTPAFQRVIQGAAMQAWENGDTAVTGIDCLVQLFAEWKSTAAQQLAAQRMTQKQALEFIKRGTSDRH